MATDKQNQANHSNSLKSTGPKTPGGKDRSKRNALRHGIFSEVSLLPDENAAQFSEFSQSMRTNLDPVGDLENLLVDRIVSSTWRLRRLIRVEGEMFEDMRIGKDQFGLDFDKGLGHAFVVDSCNYHGFEKLNRYETTLERSIMKALHELQRVQAVRQGKNVQLPLAFDIDITQGAGNILKE